MEKLKILWNNRIFYAIMRRNYAKKSNIMGNTETNIET